MDFTAPGTPVDTIADRLTVDPDLDNLHLDQPEPSDLDDLRAELTAQVAPSTVIKVLGRPRYAVRFRTDFTGKDLDNLRKRAKDKRYKDGVDGIRFASLLLALTCEAILRDGKPLDLDGTSPVTFTSRELQDLLGTAGNPNPADATVRALYGLEGHVNAAAEKLMTEAGWGDEADVADPTE